MLGAPLLPNCLSPLGIFDFFVGFLLSSAHRFVHLTVENDPNKPQFTSFFNAIIASACVRAQSVSCVSL